MTINFVQHISDLVISQIGLSRTLVDANGIIDVLLYVFVVTHLTARKQRAVRC